GLFVEPAAGDNTNSGVRASPFRTIEHAASIARAGEEIVLLPGTYDSTTEPIFLGPNGIRIPDGVNVRADQLGTVNIRTGRSIGFEFLGRSSITDIRFDQSANAVTSTQGAVLISGVSFGETGETCGPGGISGPIYLGGAATATLTAGSTT